MFKTREDLYHSRTFETQEEALDFIKAKAASLKKDGYTVMDMGVREFYDYGDATPRGVPVESVPAGYAGQVSAKKEAPPSKEDEEANEVPLVN